MPANESIKSIWMVSKKSISRWAMVLSIFLLFFTLVSKTAQSQTNWRKVMQLKDEIYEPFAVDATPKNPAYYKSPPPLSKVSFVDNRFGWAVGFTGSLLQTNDEGDTWKQIAFDIYFNFEDVFIKQSREVLVVGNSMGQGYLMVTKDEGKKWDTAFKMGGGLMSLSFVDDKNGWICGYIEEKKRQGAAIFRTKNGGKNWALQYLNQEYPDVILKVHFIDEKHGWALTQDTILHSDDGGETWKKQYTAARGYLSDIEIITSLEGWAVGSEQSLLHTVDGGKNWMEAKLPETQVYLPWLGCVRFSNKKNGWIGGTKGYLYSTKNGGLSWKIERVLEKDFFKNIFITSRNMIAVTSNGAIYKSPIY